MKLQAILAFLLSQIRRKNSRAVINVYMLNKNTYTDTKHRNFPQFK